MIKFQVTWIEHIEYDENCIHQLYRPLLRSGNAFGARRWLATLQRECEYAAIFMCPSPDDNAGFFLTPKIFVNLKSLWQSLRWMIIFLLYLSRDCSRFNPRGQEEHLKADEANKQQFLLWTLCLIFAPVGEAAGWRLGSWCMCDDPGEHKRTWWAFWCGGKRLYIRVDAIVKATSLWLPSGWEITREMGHLIQWCALGSHSPAFQEPGWHQLYFSLLPTSECMNLKLTS